jgi:hypothetical protein
VQTLGITKKSSEFLDRATLKTETALGGKEFKQNNVREAVSKYAPQDKKSKFLVLQKRYFDAYWINCGRVTY